MPEARDLSAVLGRLERWTLPLAIALLFAYPNPLVWPALAIAVAFGLLHLVRRETWSRLAVVDPWIGLLAAGTLIGLIVAHQQDAALLRLTGMAGAIGLFYGLRGYLARPTRPTRQTGATGQIGQAVTHRDGEREIRQVAMAVLGATVLGILAVLALLRGSLPESAVTSALSPLLLPFSVFPGISGDTLDVNARFTVHQYGLAQVVMVAAVFAVAAVALSPNRAVMVAGGAALLLLLPLLLATQARGAFLALALASTIVAAFRTRLAWLILPLAGGLLWVLLQRGTISRGVETEWLNQRLGYWTGTLSLLGDLPLTGAGLGMRTFAEVFAWYHQLPDPYQVSHTHNVVIQAYAEQGLLGALGLAGLLALGSAVSLRAVRRTSGPTCWLVGGAAGGFLGSAIYGMTDQVPTNNLSLALLLALLAVTLTADRVWAPASSKGIAPSSGEAPAPAVSSAPAAASRRRLALGALAAVGLVGLAALSPRWISGLMLNVGASQLLSAQLDRPRDAHLRAARLQRAESALDTSLRWNSRNIPAWRNLGWARLQRHDLQGAVTAIDSAYRPDLTSFERAQLARLANDAGLIGLTIKLYQEGGDETRLKALGERLWSARRYHDAALAYAALTDMHPDEAEYVSNFAKVVLEGGGDDREALDALIAAVRRKPQAARSLSSQLVLKGEPFRSNEKRQGGNFPAARFWFNLASQVDPTYDRPEVELGAIHFYRGLYEQAAVHFHEAQRRDPRNPSTMHQLGETYLKLGRTDEALAFYQQGVALRPDRAELHLNLGRAYLVAGRRDDARQELLVAVERSQPTSEVGIAAREELRTLDAGG